MTLRFFLAAPFLLMIAACASTGADHFSDLKEGMDKDQVLQIVGNPFRTEKNAVAEKWGYRYFTGDDKSIEVFKYVRFINGQVSSFGDDSEESRRLQRLKTKEQKHEVLEKKKEHVDDVLEKEYSH